LDQPAYALPGVLLPVTFTDRISVDRATGVGAGSLYVDPSADYLRDHFPGAPTLPGLVMLETAVRVAAALTEAEGEGAALLDQVERLQVTRRVGPGDTLEVMVQRETNAPEEATFVARGSVEGMVAMRARFRLRRVGTGEIQWRSEWKQR
jgi:3-hydroxymyristoyl/3-hydroxydecanoyl-(acyl carrier protein) dehydratase